MGALSFASLGCGGCFSFVDLIAVGGDWSDGFCWWLVRLSNAGWALSLDLYRLA